MLPILFSDTGATSQDGSHSAIFRMQGPEGCGLPYSKTFEELFCLSLDIFQEEGGLPDSKDDEVLFSALA